jgi:hypothetical protein
MCYTPAFNLPETTNMVLDAAGLAQLYADLGISFSCHPSLTATYLVMAGLSFATRPQRPSNHFLVFSHS